MNDNNILSLCELLSTPKKIVITTHYKPDADALGSSLALAGILIADKHEVTVIVPSGYPEFLSWMKGNEKVIVADEKNEKDIDSYFAKADVLFCLDFNGLNRLNILEDFARKSKATRVLIDHHVNPENFANIMFSDPSKSSTCEYLYEIVKAMGYEKYINKDIAEAFYSGIMTDTGQFKHSNSSKSAYLTSIALMDLGADVSSVANRIYDCNSINRLKFVGHALNHCLNILKGYKVAYFFLSKNDFAKFALKPGDTEGLVNYALSIKGVQVAALITDKPKEGVRMSFRSKGNFSVAEFASKYFNGGGHVNASGAASSLPLSETVKKFEELIKSYSELKVAD